MKGKLWKQLIACALIASWSESAAAQSCYSLRSELSAINREGSALAQYEWGSALVLGGCLMVGMDNYQRTRSQSEAAAAVVVCSGAGCALTTDYQNCLGVVSRLFIYALRAKLIEDQLYVRC